MGGLYQAAQSGGGLVQPPRSTIVRPGRRVARCRLRATLAARTSGRRLSAQARSVAERQPFRRPTASETTCRVLSQFVRWRPSDVRLSVQVQPPDFWPTSPCPSEDRQPREPTGTACAPPWPAARAKTTALPYNASKHRLRRAPQGERKEARACTLRLILFRCRPGSPSQASPHPGRGLSPLFQTGTKRPRATLPGFCSSVQRRRSKHLHRPVGPAALAGTPVDHHHEADPSPRHGKGGPEPPPPRLDGSETMRHLEMGKPASGRTVPGRRDRKSPNGPTTPGPRAYLERRTLKVVSLFPVGTGHRITAKNNKGQKFVRPLSWGANPLTWEG